MPRSSKWSRSFRFSHQNAVSLFFGHNTCLPRATPTSFFFSFKRNILYLLWSANHEASRYEIFVQSSVTPSQLGQMSSPAPYSQTLRIFSSVNTGHRGLHPYRTTRNIFPWILVLRFAEYTASGRKKTDNVRNWSARNCFISAVSIY